MTKKLFPVLLLTGSFTFAQVGINTASPQATLDIVGNPTDTAEFDGIIAPRITEDQLAAKTYTSSQTGAIIYVTAAASTNTGQVVNVVSPGYYYFDGTIWQASAGNDWHTTGNPGTVPGTNFIGTTDARSLLVKTNNIKSGYIDIASNGNTGVGYNTMTGSSFSTSGSALNNVAIGQNTLSNATSGFTWSNIAIGNNVLKSATDPRYNTAIGDNSQMNLTTGRNNVSVGVGTLGNVTVGGLNTAIGGSSLAALTIGTANTALGLNSLSVVTTGNANIGIGQLAGSNITSGSNNIVIGVYNNQVVDPVKNGQLNIGNLITGTGVGGSVYATTTDSKRIGIAMTLGTVPNSTLQVGGSLSLPDIAPNSGSLLLDETHYMVRIFDGNTGVTLPDASTCKGRIYILIGSNGIGTKSIITTAGPGIYDDVTNSNITSISANQRYQIQSDGTDWIVVGR